MTELESYLLKSVQTLLVEFETLEKASSDSFQTLQTQNQDLMKQFSEVSEQLSETIDQSNKTLNQSNELIDQFNKMIDQFKALQNNSDTLAKSVWQLQAGHGK